MIKKNIYRIHYSIILFLSVLVPVYAEGIRSFDFLQKNQMPMKNELNVYACSAAPSKIYRNNSFIFSSASLLTKESYNTCQITAYAALQQFNKSSVFLIDTRTQPEFIQLSIPGSLNIPLYAIKTKKFLKNKKLFLINRGDKSFMLNKTCQKLKTLGFDVHVVSGGLNSWLKFGHFSGYNLTTINKLNQITAQTLYSELSLPDILLIALEDHDSNQDIKLDVNNTTHVIASNENVNLITRQLNQLIKKYPESRRLVIYTEDGHIPAQVKAVFKNQLDRTVFYLSGGKYAFQHYQKEQIALQKRRQQPPNKLYRCQG